MLGAGRAETTIGTVLVACRAAWIASPTIGTMASGRTIFDAKSARCEESHTGGLIVDRASTSTFPGMIPEIDVWRVATLMLKRYGNEAEAESERRADELWEVGDAAGMAV